MIVGPDYFSIILIILYYLFWPFVIISAIIYFLRRRWQGGVRIEREWYDKSFLSKEDFVGQIFILFSVILANIAFWLINNETGRIVDGGTIFLISSLIGLIIGYYFKAIWTFVLSTAGLVLWWFYQAAIWATQAIIYSGASSAPMNYGSKVLISPSFPRYGETVKPISFIAAFIFIAIIFYLLGRILESKEIYKRLAKFYSFFGLISITGVLFIFSSNFGLELIEGATKGIMFFNSLEITISFAFFLGILAVLLIFSFKEKLVFFQEVMAAGFLVMFFMIIALLPQQSIFITSFSRYSSYHQFFSATGIFWALIFNCLVFFEILGIVFLGYLRRQNFLINLGAVSLFLLIIVKYFDWFGNLAGGAFLIGAGILLFVVGWSMEKGRRYMIAKIQKTEVR
jgi:hypothetical protein